MKKLFLAVAVPAMILWMSGLASAFSVTYTAPVMPGVALDEGETLQIGFDITNNEVFIDDVYDQDFSPEINFNYMTHEVVSPLTLTLTVLNLTSSGGVDSVILQYKNDELLNKELPNWLTVISVNADGSLSDLNIDGRVDYIIIANTGDLSVGSFIMTGEIEPKTPEVPIPAAVWMLGTGIFALISVRRIKFL